MASAGVLPDQKLEKQIEKQMGCMTGFLHIFDRHQILTGKRLYSTKRLTTSPGQAVDSAIPLEKSDGSPSPSPMQRSSPSVSPPEITKSTTTTTCSETRSPVPEKLTTTTTVEIPVRMASPLQVLDVKESLRTPWKFREAPRLSLDSRATVDGKGSLYPKEIRTNANVFSSGRCQSFAESTDSDDNDKNRRSPSVIARLMGLEALPDSGREPIKKVELRRSASESRVSRDLRFAGDGNNNNNTNNNFKVKQSDYPSVSGYRDNAVGEDDLHRSKARGVDSMEFGGGRGVRNAKSQQQQQQQQHQQQHPQRAPNGGCFVSSHWNSQQQRKSFFDSQDFFPEPKQNGSLYGEIERRLKMRGIDEPEKDLETLKQILEALQLKGLLHSKKPAERISNRNFVFDRRFSYEESPIVIMKPARSVSPRGGRFSSGGESPPPHSNFRSKTGINRNNNNNNNNNNNLAGDGRARVNRPEMDRNNQQKERRARNSRSPDLIESNVRSPSSLARRKPLSIETQRRGNNDKASSPSQSPRVSPRRTTGSDQNQNQNQNQNHTTTSRSPRNRKFVTEISPKERISSPIDDDSSAISESSASTSTSPIDSERSKPEDYKEGRSLLERCDKLLHSIAEITSSEAELQPSPVSVLDSSFYKDESSPSPVLRRRCIDFKDRDQSMELEDEMWSPMISPLRMKFEEKSEQDSDFIYVSEILRVSECLSEDADVFLILEKQQYNGSSSKASKLHRRLVFDTVMEILDRKTQLPPWKALALSSSSNGKSGFRQVWLEFKRVRERETTEDLFEVICGALKKDMTGDAVNGWDDCPMETSEAVLDIERLIFKDLVADTIQDLASFAGRSISTVPRRTLVF